MAILWPYMGHKYHVFGSASYKLCLFKYILILEHANILIHHTQKPWYPNYYHMVAKTPPKWPYMIKMPFFLVFCLLFALNPTTCVRLSIFLYWSIQTY